MFKKLNSKLLSKYPLLWNTRLPIVLPAILIIHGLFYLGGFFYNIQVTDLWDDSHFRLYGITIFSALVTLVIIILWLVFYLRNNPFKSFYTLGRNYLFAEYWLIFIVFFSSATFFLTYKQGLYDNITRKTKNFDLEKEANLVNLAHHFIAFDKDDFTIYDCCDSVEARWLRDSIRSAIHEKYKATKDEKLLEQLPPSEATNPEGKYIIDTLRYKYSYLYYCDAGISLSPSAVSADLLSNYQLNDIAEGLLKNHKKDSVRIILDQLIELCRKYGVKHRFDAQLQVEDCFNDEDFTVGLTTEKYDREDYYAPDYYFIETNDLFSALHKVAEVRNGFWNYQVWVTILYYVLGISIVLSSFRLTRTKHWFISLVGIILWVIIFSLVGIVAHKNTPIIVLMVWLVLFILAALFIRNRENKLFSGVMFNWAYWFSPAVIPFIFIILEINTNDECWKEENKLTDACQLNAWIDHNWWLINTCNFFLVIILIYFVFIPLARKWQSNPEE